MQCTLIILISPIPYQPYPDSLVRCEDRIGDACKDRYESKRSRARKYSSDMLRFLISAVPCSSAAANVALAVLHVPLEKAASAVMVRKEVQCEGRRVYSTTLWPFVRI